jgi:hypothetical protein
MMNENLKEKSLALRCLALTGSFETGQLAPLCFAAVAGNFDGQGMSFGALQWNLGKGTLQPLLWQMFDDHKESCLRIFGDDFEPLKKAMTGGKEASIAWAVYMQTQRDSGTPWRIWKEKFRLLGLTRELQAIQTRAAADYYAKAVRLCEEYGLWTERGRALMFDIAVQNGGIPSSVKAIIFEDFETLDQRPAGESFELARMRIIANRRAEAANPKWIEDVRKRKLCIAEGSGRVHGIEYDLEEQFGIGMRAA